MQTTPRRLANKCTRGINTVLGTTGGTTTSNNAGAANQNPAAFGMTGPAHDGGYMPWGQGPAQPQFRDDPPEEPEERYVARSRPAYSEVDYGVPDDGYGGPSASSSKRAMDEEDDDFDLDIDSDEDDFDIPDDDDGGPVGHTRRKGVARRARSSRQRHAPSHLEEERNYPMRGGGGRQDDRSSGGGRSGSYGYPPQQPMYQQGPPQQGGGYGHGYGQAPSQGQVQQNLAQSMARVGNQEVKTGDQLSVPRGQLVAAKIIEPDKEPTWILASVVEHMSEKGKYRVKDDDPNEGVDAPEYLVNGRHVVWLSEAADIMTRPGEDVLALYPDCTSFYKAKVVSAPPTKAEKYQLFFDGEASGQVRPIDCCYVFPWIG